jgi:hypothetical protein
MLRVFVNWASCFFLLSLRFTLSKSAAASESIISLRSFMSPTLFVYPAYSMGSWYTLFMTESQSSMTAKVSVSRFISRFSSSESMSSMVSFFGNARRSRGRV